MVMIVLDLAASSAGEAATVAPASASGLVLSADRFQTVTLCPISISRSAMAAPILPTPAIPTSITSYSAFPLRGRYAIPPRRSTALPLCPIGARGKVRVASRALQRRRSEEHTSELQSLRH